MWTMTWTEVAGFITTALCVWLVARPSVWNWPAPRSLPVATGRTVTPPIARSRQHQEPCISHSIEKLRQYIHQAHGSMICRVLIRALSKLFAPLQSLVLAH